MDRCYRKEPFPNDRARVEHLFTLYEKLTAPLVVEKKKPARTRAVKDPRIPPDWWPGESQDLLFACALRFDGEKLDRQLLREGAAAPDGSTYPALKHLYDTHEACSLERLDDVRLIFGVLFLLQRARKWQDMLNDRDRLLYLKLFLRLHDEDVPAGYEYPDFLRNYESRRREARALADTLRPVVTRLENAR